MIVPDPLELTSSVPPSCRTLSLMPLIPTPGVPSFPVRWGEAPRLESGAKSVMKSGAVGRFRAPALIVLG